MWGGISHCAGRLSLRGHVEVHLTVILAFPKIMSPASRSCRRVSLVTTHDHSRGHAIFHPVDESSICLRLQPGKDVRSHSSRHAQCYISHNSILCTIQSRTSREDQSQCGTLITIGIPCSLLRSVPVLLSLSRFLALSSTLALGATDMIAFRSSPCWL